MLEEVSDLRFQQLWQIVNVFNVIVFFAQLAVRNRNQFRIFTGFPVIFRTPTDGNGSQNPAAAGTFGTIL